jgi:integrase/recombinase XerC
VPLGPHLVEVLETYLRRGRRALAGPRVDPALFLTQHGDRLSVPSLVFLLWEAGQRIGLPRLGAHALRRACATHILAAGADLESVRRLLGHACGDTAQNYAALTWPQVKAEHDRTHPRQSTH